MAIPWLPMVLNRSRWRVDGSGFLKFEQWAVRAILDGFCIVMAVDAQLVQCWLALSKCVFDCLWSYDWQPGSPSFRLRWRRIVGWFHIPGSIASWPVWASQEPPISTALLTHLRSALRALHSCRLLGLPVPSTGICSHPVLWIHWSRLTASMQLIPDSWSTARNHDEDVPSTSLY